MKLCWLLTISIRCHFSSSTSSLVSDKHVPACRFQSVSPGSGALAWFFHIARSKSELCILLWCLAAQTVAARHLSSCWWLWLNFQHTTSRVRKSTELLRHKTPDFTPDTWPSNTPHHTSILYTTGYGQLFRYAFTRNSKGRQASSMSCGFYLKLKYILRSWSLQHSSNLTEYSTCQQHQGTWGNHLQSTFNEWASTLLDSCARTIYGLRLLRAHGMHELRLHSTRSSVLRSWPSWCMQVQLGRASAPQVTSTNWSNFLTDANVSITAIRPLTTPCISEQFDKADEFLFQTVTFDSHHVLHRLLPAINKNLAIANRSRVSCAHNTLRASIGINITSWHWNLG